jgi:hypothetical protein
MAKGKSGMKATKDIVAMARDLMEQNHPLAFEAGVKVGIVLVYAESGPALKLRGQPCAATIQAVPWEMRIVGAPDCLMKIDGKVWKALEANPRHPKPQMALIDHELTHIGVKFDDRGEVKKDAAGRPTVGMVPHDFELGVFKSIIDRWGMDSIDAYNVAVTALESGGQLMLPFLEGSAEIVHPTGQFRSSVEIVPEGYEIADVPDSASIGPGVMNDVADAILSMRRAAN